MQQISLFFLVFLIFSPYAKGEAGMDGYSHISGADCTLKATGGSLRSILVQVDQNSARVSVYTGPHNPVDASRNLSIAGQARFSRLVGFPKRDAETLRLDLDPSLQQFLGRPHLMISARTFAADDENYVEAYLSNPLTEEEDLELFCLPSFTSVKEDLGKNDPLLVKPAQNPSICAIEFKGTLPQWTHGCTAAVVAPEKLLSAAHCEEGYRREELRVRCGNQILGIKSWQSNRAYHTQEHSTDSSKDTSLVELDGVVSAPVLGIEWDSKKIQSLLLEGGRCTHYGMGMRQGGTIGLLFQADYAFPRPALGGEPYVRRIFEMSHMIASDPERFLRPGDSGGPILCQDSAGREKIVGVHSFVSVSSTAAFSAMTSESADFLRPLLLEKF